MSQWARNNPEAMDEIAGLPLGEQVAALRSAISTDPHEVDHSFTDDGSGHCSTCGVPSVDLEAQQAAALEAIAAMVPTDDEWRSAADFMGAVAETLDAAGVKRPATYEDGGS